MHAARFGIDLLDQRVGVGGFQLRELAPFQHPRRQCVPGIGEALQHARIRPPRAGRHPPPAAHAHLVEQDLAELLGAAEIELPAGEAMDVFLHLRHPVRELHRDAAKLVGIDAHARLFHRRQHRAQPPVDLLVERQARDGCAASAAARATAAASRRHSRRHRQWRDRAGTRANGMRLRPVPVTSL